MTTLSSGFPCHPVAPHPLVPAVCVGDTTQSNTTTITTSRSSKSSSSKSSSSRSSRKVAKAAAGSGYRCKKGRGEMGGSGQTYDKPQTASSNSKHEPLLAVLSIGKHGEANTNSEQGGGCREDGAGCRVQRAPTALMAKTKACLGAQPPFELHFLFLSCCGACQAPLGRLGNVSIIASKSPGMGGKRGGGPDKRIVLHVQLCACMCVRVSVFTVNRNSCRATHTGLNQLHLSNGRDYKCNCSCKCRPLL